MTTCSSQARTLCGRRNPHPRQIPEADLRPEDDLLFLESGGNLPRLSEALVYPGGEDIRLDWLSLQLEPLPAVGS